MSNVQEAFVGPPGDQKAVAKALRVLIVEDTPDDAEVLLLELKRAGYRTSHERVEHAAAMKVALEREQWDLVVSDYSMPSFSALAALEVLKETDLDLPFIIVSGTVGEDTAVVALKAGAHDFLLKSRLARLGPAIERELREAEMRRAKKGAEEALIVADRMVSVGTLAAGVAHEINNPLAAVIANLDAAVRDLAELAEQTGSTPLVQELRDEIRDARQSADRVRLIVRDLKIFSRGETEERGPVDVEKVMESTLRMAWNEIRHRARLVKSYGTVRPIEASEGRLGQVFLNLIVNAAQAIPEGRADTNEIRIAIKEENDRVVVEIGDTGTGIPPAVMKRLFTPFVTTKPVGEGTGLGLSICHRIITGFGGDITVESKPGAGAVFRLSFVPTTDDFEPLQAPVVSSHPALRRGKILVIDDEPLVAKAVQRSLGTVHEVIALHRSHEALTLLSTGEHFDVILCDLMMPEMTGVEFHQQLLAVAPAQAARIVFLTGGAFTPTARAFLEKIPNQCVEKPFNADHLLALINDRVK